MATGGRSISRDSTSLRASGQNGNAPGLARSAVSKLLRSTGKIAKRRSPARLSQKPSVKPERGLADEQQARLASIVESSDDAIVSKDLNGIVRTWNPAAQRVLGYREREIIGRPVMLLIPPTRRPEEKMILSRIRRGEHVKRGEAANSVHSGLS